MEVSFSSNSAPSKASSSESTASSVNCVTVSDTDVSVPARKKTKLSTKLTRTNCSLARQTLPLQARGGSGAMLYTSLFNCNQNHV